MLKTESLSLAAAALLGLAGLTGCAAVIPVQASSTDEPTVQARERSAMSARAEAKLGTSCDNGTMVRTAYCWQGRHRPAVRPGGDDRRPSDVAVRDEAHGH